MLLQIFLASFVSGLLSAMGFGSGTILIIWLTSYLSYGQLQAQGVNLLFFLPCAAFSLFMLAKRGLVNKSEALPLALGGIVGIILGHLILPHIPTEYLSKLFGAFVIFLAFKQLYHLKSSSSSKASDPPEQTHKQN